MTEHQVDVQTFFNQNSLAPIQRLVLSLCFLVVAIDGFDTAVIGFLAPAIRAEWGSNQAELTSMMMSGSAGLLVGAFLFGPLSDRFGRRPMLIVTCFVFGAMCLLSGYASSIKMLTLLRFLTGLGLGGAMPNAITLSTEYSPDHRRASLVTLMFCGFTLGMASAGFIAAAVVPTWGWRSMLLIGGGAPLVLVPVLMAYLPESARFLALTRRGDQKIAAILSRISQDPKLASATFIATETARGAPIQLLFSKGLARGTLLLWMTTFMSLLVVYVVGNWLPLILTDAGLGKENATLITTGFHLGGVVGGILLGQLMDRFNENKVLAGSYLAAAVFIGVVGSSTDNIVLLALCVFGAGMCVSGTQTGVQALASGFYPTGARATGVSWMNAVGRSGSILGSFAGGLTIALGWDAGQILVMLIGPAMLAAFGMYAMARIRQARRT